MPIKGDDAHSIIDPASTDTTGSTQLKVSQTRKSKLQIPGGISKASERGNRLQHSQPDSQLQGASRLKDVSTSARMVMIIFKAHEQGKWVNTYKMTINPSELSDLSMATFYDKDLKLIASAQCFDTAIEDGTNTVFMVFGRELNVDEEMVASVSQNTNSE
ncbi:hypothetical protein BDBG_03902 [Blastomyces gilchristii SLH14081]|uniref:Uncharacterized protein n=1 Tax=Blastomyces gilchristii (strain SLH14081) TaxID=559298 RepID=A0A179UIR5_BLAGS|nr:uncharacterized protein BDBG_03902 [Blastomyces gilchristii SLH14081]OAT07884.1 hypothetical protein BDBG_03902 [Blastomyces gilchristii SLH14081]